MRFGVFTAAFTMPLFYRAIGFFCAIIGG